MGAADITKPPAGTVPTPSDDYDSPWKEVSGRFFPELVEFFAPDLYAIIDWPAGHEFLEQEDEEPDWEPKSYEHTLHGTKVDFGYRTVKLWEYNGRWTELEKDPYRAPSLRRSDTLRHRPRHRRDEGAAAVDEL